MRVLQFPVIAFSPAGWLKTATEVEELTDASPDDDLSDWLGLVIYDSSGLKYLAVRVYRIWPASRLGAWMCRVLGVAIHVDMDLATPSAASLDELRNRVIGYYGETSALREAVTHKDLITKIL